MLSIHSAISDADIADVRVLRSGTVYLFEGHGRDKLVVKVEPSNVYATGSTFKNAKLAIKSVDKLGGAVKQLTAGEIQAMADWAAWVKGICERYAKNKVNNAGAPADVEELLGRLTSNSGKKDLWYKMPLADLTDADRLLHQRLGTATGKADKSVMKMFADGLNEPGGIEQLGRIIAADMYNSNQDRFHPTRGSEHTYGSKTLKFKVCVNVGNIFVVGKETQQRMRVSGHDFIDPSSGYRDYETSLKETKSDYNQQWLGEHLCKASLRKKFVKNVVHDLESIITPNRSSLAMFGKLSKAESRLEKGMLDGMRMIVAGVTSTYSKPNAKWPQGAKERCDKFRAATK